MRIFVVRVAELDPDRPVDPARIRGVVDDVASGSRTPFRSAEDLVALLESGVADGQAR